MLRGVEFGSIFNHQLNIYAMKKCKFNFDAANATKNYEADFSDPSNIEKHFEFFSDKLGEPISLAKYKLEWPINKVRWIDKQRFVLADFKSLNFLSSYSLKISSIGSLDEIIEHNSKQKKEYSDSDSTFYRSNISQLNPDRSSPCFPPQKSLLVDSYINTIGYSHEILPLKGSEKDLIACAPANGDVFIFNEKNKLKICKDSLIKYRSKYSSRGKPCKSISQSSEQNKLLYATSNQLFLADLNQTLLKESSVLQLNDNKLSIEKVSFNANAKSIYCYSLSNGTILINDLRDSSAGQNFKAHIGSCNDLDFHPYNQSLILTCGGENSIHLWDLRNTNIRLHSFELHKKEVVRCKWMQKENQFFSVGKDQLINIWSLERIGRSINSIFAEDNASELVFSYKEHNSSILDCDAHPLQDVLCSTDLDNNLHVWGFKPIDF